LARHAPEARLTRTTLAAVLVFLALGASARAVEPEWEKIAAIPRIEIVTHDEDGKARETTIWFVVLDGQGFIRTGNSYWLANIQRNPADVVLRIEDVEYPLSAEFIESDKLRERVTAAFHAKYGWTDSLVHVFRGGRPNIMHMVSR
jgi:hypothetical protein